MPITDFIHNRNKSWGSMDGQDTSDATRRQHRRAQPKAMSPITPVETIRTRLGLNKQNFGEALGLNPSTYAGYVTKGFCTKTLALAAEALMRRQASSGEVADEVFILRIIKGTPTAIRINELQRMQLNGQEFYLVPVKDTRI